MSHKFERTVMFSCFISQIKLFEIVTFIIDEPVDIKEASNTNIEILFHLYSKQ